MLIPFNLARSAYLLLLLLLLFLFISF